MNYILLLISVIFFCLNAVSTRLFQTKVSPKHAPLRLFQAGFCITASVLSALLFGFFIPEPATVVRAVLFGILFAAATHMCALCFECGSMSLTYVIINMSMAVPLVYSFVVFSENVALYRIFGLALMVLTFILTGIADRNEKRTNDSSENSKETNVSTKLWIVFVTIGFLANGITAVLQKVNNFYSGEHSGGAFLTIGYFVAALYFMLLFITDKRKTKAIENKIAVLPMLALIITAGAGSSVGNCILGVLSTKIEAAILYPSLNGGLALLTAAVSVCFFGEKTNRLKAASFVTGVCAIILLAL